MSDYPSRLRSMADFSPEAQTLTKIIPAGAAFLRETATHIAELEAALDDLVMAAELPGDHCELTPAIARAKHVLTKSTS